MTVKPSRPLLDFAGGEPLRDLSAVAAVGRHLFVASDELTRVERLTPDDAGETYSDHRPFELHEFVNLPARGKKKPNGKPLDQEVDVEGMDYADGYLWLVGSHGAKRKKLDADDKDKGDAKNIGRLAKIEREGNRFLLARVAVAGEDDEDGPFLRAASEDGSRTSARLACTTSSSALTDELLAGDGDPHLAPFVMLPGKDNGFDVEGLAVAGERIFLGLRGPVLRGWSVVLELEIGAGRAGELKLKKVGAEGRRYLKHFLDLGGLGVRELCRDGEDMLVLAGPTMDLDGPVRVFRWRGGARPSETDRVVWKEDLKPLFDVPHGDGTDHAEGMTLVPHEGRPALLVVHDSPDPARLVGDRAVRADLFPLS